MQVRAAGSSIADRFELVRTLGEGGMGEVWRARDRDLDETVALKFLPGAWVADPARIAALKSECRHARRLVHPNIVRVFDFHTTDDDAFISMQFVDGESLAATEALGGAEIVTAISTVCDALDYAHRAGIVHGDIKPANVLRSRTGAVFLADFGLASESGREMSARGGGSLPYLSPQRAAGDAPTVADDIYAIGATLFELLAGHPPFAPAITPERIATETIVVPDSDRNGESLPASLRDLVAACMSKAAESRPAGIAAVRAALDDALADLGEAEIQLVPRQRAADAAVQTEPPALHTQTTKPSASPALVYGGLGVLLAAVAAVVFLLPTIVAERDVGSSRLPAIPAEPEAAAPPAISEAQREVADEALGELLVLDGQLRDLGVALWGGAEWRTARIKADDGDTAYRERNFGPATAAYREALTVMRRLEPLAPEVLERALADAQVAFADGNQADAVQNFELALAVDDDNDVARAGLERAMQLDRVLELMAEAQQYESAGQLERANANYTDALALDPEWQPAADGLGRTGRGLSAANFERQMAAGLAAQNRGDFSGARRAFRAALSARPGDTNAQRALSELATQEKLATVNDIEQSARELERQEQWEAAAAAYSSALERDENLSSATRGVARARDRLALEQELLTRIDRADQLYVDAELRRARAALERAGAVDHPGPRLTGQIKELAGLIARAAIPIEVTFESDNLTSVTIFKVGPLGTFATRQISLKPGRYTAVGSRDGFRDVRRIFSVSSDDPAGPIVLRCEEPI